MLVDTVSGIQDSGGGLVEGRFGRDLFLGVVELVQVGGLGQVIRLWGQVGLELHLGRHVLEGLGFVRDLAAELLFEDLDLLQVFGSLLLFQLVQEQVLLQEVSGEQPDLSYALQDTSQFMADDLVHDLLEHFLDVNKPFALLIQQLSYVVLEFDSIEHLDERHDLVELLELPGVLVDEDQVGQGAHQGVYLTVVDLLVLLFEFWAVVVQFGQFVLLQLQSVQQDLLGEGVLLEF